MVVTNVVCVWGAAGMYWTEVRAACPRTNNYEAPNAEVEKPELYSSEALLKTGK